MSLISKKSFLYDEEEDQNVEPYVLPSLVTSKPEVIPIRKSLAISTALHPTVVGLIWLISILLALAGINLFKFDFSAGDLIIGVSSSRIINLHSSEQ